MVKINSLRSPLTKSYIIKICINSKLWDLKKINFLGCNSRKKTGIKNITLKILVFSFNYNSLHNFYSPPEIVEPKL